MMFWVGLLAIFSNFTCFLLCCAILIISYTHDHFHLAEGVSMEMASLRQDGMKSDKGRRQTRPSCL
jgi:hypothetical protein